MKENTPTAKKRGRPSKSTKTPSPPNNNKTIESYFKTDENKQLNTSDQSIESKDTKSIDHDETRRKRGRLARNLSTPNTLSKQQTAQTDNQIQNNAEKRPESKRGRKPKTFHETNPTVKKPKTSTLGKKENDA
jgi:hypothetical protein